MLGQRPLLAKGDCDRYLHRLLGHYGKRELLPKEQHVDDFGDEASPDYDDLYEAMDGDDMKNEGPKLSPYYVSGKDTTTPQRKNVQRCRAQNVAFNKTCQMSSKMDSENNEKNAVNGNTGGIYSPTVNCIHTDVGLPIRPFRLQGRVLRHQLHPEMQRELY
nr:hypothetical protein BaRGS_026785 [Batillaria attramentaria]